MLTSAHKRHPGSWQRARTLAVGITVLSLVCGLGSRPADGQVPAPVKPVKTAATVLDPQSFQHYVSQFMREEKDATGKAGPDSWPWMQANIPWFESSDSSTQEMYYFRWYSFQKHIVETPDGDVISEFLPRMKWAGYGNTVGVAVPHQLREARWLRDTSLAESDAHFWFSPDAPHRRDFSVALADAADAVTLATGHNQFSEALLPAMVDNYHAWESTHQDTNGLFWSIDTRDGMEVSISGDGYRPTLNSYMFGDAQAIVRIAGLKGDTALTAEFTRKAEEQRERIEHLLWNPKDQFYEVLSPSADSGIRKQAKFKDPGTAMQFSGVRELIGYIPWYFNIPSARHAVAWKQINEMQGFAARFGLTTAERRSPRFRYANGDQCQWNGPLWAFAMTQTLVAMANLLDNGQQRFVKRGDYFSLFSKYVASQHLRLANGEVIPWIDEAQDPDTGAWITQQLLIERKSPLAGRGAYYDHSGFADPLITGLIGLRPQAGNQIVIHPLLPQRAWSYFALDGLPYHGHIITLVYDRTGKRYAFGKGLTLLIDGKRAASRPDLGELHATLPS